jgi:hypothetical protein
VGAVLVPGDDDASDLVVQRVLSGLVFRSLYVPSRRSITICATDPRTPNQIGVPMQMMSAALIFSRMRGHSSPFPSSDVTPNRTA